MKKSPLFLIAVTAFLLTSATAAMADHYTTTTRHTTLEQGAYEAERKTYNNFNGDQPTGPERAYMTRTEKSVVIDDMDRTTITTYVNERSYCPAGISKETCIAKASENRYMRGQMIPSQVRYEQLPTTIHSRLSAPPQGTRYVVVDKNVYLINDENRQVLDSVYVLND